MTISVALLQATLGAVEIGVEPPGRRGRTDPRSMESAYRPRDMSARYGTATDAPTHLINGTIIPRCPICEVAAGQWCVDKAGKRNAKLHVTRFRNGSEPTLAP